MLRDRLARCPSPLANEAVRPVQRISRNRSAVPVPMARSRRRWLILTTRDKRPPLPAPRTRRRMKTMITAIRPEITEVRGRCCPESATDSRDAESTRKAYIESVWPVAAVYCEEEDRILVYPQWTRRPQMDRTATATQGPSSQCARSVNARPQRERTDQTREAVMAAELLTTRAPSRSPDRGMGLGRSQGMAGFRREENEETRSFDVRNLVCNESASTWWITRGAFADAGPGQRATATRTRRRSEGDRPKAKDGSASSTDSDRRPDAVPCTSVAIQRTASTLSRLGRGHRWRSATGP